MPLGRAVRLAEEALGAYLAPAAGERAGGRRAMTDAGAPSGRAPSSTSGPGRRGSTPCGSGRASARPARSWRRRWRALPRPTPAGPPAGEWTVAQVVDHVAQSTVRAAEELRHLLAGRRPPGPRCTRAPVRRGSSRSVARAPRGPAGGQRGARRGAPRGDRGARRPPPPPCPRSSSTARRTPGAWRSSSPPISPGRSTPWSSASLPGPPGADSSGPRGARDPA